MLREEVLVSTDNKFCSVCGKPGHHPKDCEGFLRSEINKEAKGEKKDQVAYARKTYYFLNLYILREYLTLDLKPKHSNPESDFLKNILPERLVDDWVFICFLVGKYIIFILYIFILFIFILYFF